MQQEPPYFYIYKSFFPATIQRKKLTQKPPPPLQYCNRNRENTKKSTDRGEGEEIIFVLLLPFIDLCIVILIFSLCIACE